MKFPRPFLTIACVLALGAVTAWANSVSTPNIPVVGPVLNGDLLLGTRSGVTYNMSWPPASALNASTFLGSTTTSNPSLSNDLTTGLYTSAPGQVGVVITTTPKASWTASRTYDYNPVTINLNTGALASTLTGSVLQLGNANATPTRIESDVYGSSSYLSSVRLDGNATSPTAILSGDEIGGVNAWGYNGAAVAGPQASVREYAAANWTTTSTPTYVDIAATPTNSTTMAEVARFYGDGGVALPSTVTGGDEGAGTLNAAGLYVNGVAVGTGSGTVTSVSVATANGFSGTVANATTTPAITIIAGAINPTSVGATTSGAVTATTVTAANAAISGTTTMGNDVVTGTTALKGTTTISGALVDTATISLTGIVAGTVSGNQFLGVNSSGTVVYGAGGSTSPAGSSGNVQYNGGSGFAANSGLNISTTTGGLTFLANVTTANLLSLGDNGADVTSYNIGAGAGLANATTGLNTIAIGDLALTAQTTGIDNTVIGTNAGKAMTTDGYNTAVGMNALLAQAGASTTTSSGNTAAGYNACSGITTATGDLCGGANSGTILTTGSSNVILGAGATAAFNSTANSVDVGAGAEVSSNSVAIGNGAGGTGGQSVAVGDNAKNPGTNSQNSVAIGYTTGQGASGSNFVGIGSNIFHNSGGSFNTVVGSQASEGTSGSNNDIFGYNIVNSSLTGNSNIIIGTNGEITALATTSTATLIGTGVRGGSLDVMYGAYAGAATTTNNNNNTAVGYQALTATTSAAGAVMGNVALGYRAGALNTTGTGNTLLGYNAGSTTLTIGSDNILIGQGISATTSADTNTINIGGIYKATGIGTPSTSQATIAGALNVTATLQQGIELSCATGLTTDGSGNINGCVASDASLKTNIQPLVYDATLIDRLQPVSYAWREPARYDDKRHSGFIAQQVQIVDPLAVKSAGKDLLGLDNSALAADIVLDLQSVHRQLAADHGAFPFHKCFFDLLVCAD